MATVVEIVDKGTGDSMLLPSEVRINGTDVGTIAENGVTVDVPGPNAPVTVTLVLIPDQVVIMREPALASAR